MESLVLHGAFSFVPGGSAAIERLLRRTRVRW